MLKIFSGDNVLAFYMSKQDGIMLAKLHQRHVLKFYQRRYYVLPLFDLGPTGSKVARIFVIPKVISASATPVTNRNLSLFVILEAC